MIRGIAGRIVIDSYCLKLPCGIATLSYSANACHGKVKIGLVAGVLPFAKRGDERGNNLVRLQQMFPRIISADFEQPHHVSPECRHLLKCILTADPDKRITIANIVKHPWFQVC